MGPMVWLSIAAGAVLGAWSRWLLGLLFNRSGHLMPWGTLLVNVAGGFVIGMALAVFERRPDLAAAWRPFLVTGFLGALTTFSSFSAEVVGMLQQGRFALAAGNAALHLLGSLALTWLGLKTAALWAVPA
jgi:CrcB protein